ncbi:MAG: hypothetical protein KO316_04755 [Methanobacterium sp.]|jgi:hypothetical protein|nr:hypothetical protein [Methanobacterium sp.]
MNINFKEKLVSAVSTIPLIAGVTMSSSCGVSCPYGLSCSYPGECRRYTDAGGDGICDLGQTSSSSTDTASSSTYDDGSSTSSTDSSSYDPASSAQDQADTSTSLVDTGNTNDSNASAVTDPGSGVDSSLGDNPNYFVIPVSMLLIGLYLFTSFLFTRGILDQQKHRRIWNILLTAGMAGSGITGILLIMIINLSIKTALNPSLTFWHVELSILMVLATVIHLHLYRKPFKNMFRVLFGIKNNWH